MTPDDLDRLEALAAAATPGPWTVGGAPAVWTDRRLPNPSLGKPFSIPERHIAAVDSAEDRAYIAALDPATVQRLIAAARLGAAWEAAEATLPEGWGMESVCRGVSPMQRREWSATAYGPWQRSSRSSEGLDGYGPTPAAALLSLAEALRGRGT